MDFFLYTYFKRQGLINGLAVSVSTRDGVRRFYQEEF